MNGYYQVSNTGKVRNPNKVLSSKCWSKATDMFMLL